MGKDFIGIKDLDFCYQDVFEELKRGNRPFNFLFRNREKQRVLAWLHIGKESEETYAILIAVEDENVLNKRELVHELWNNYENEMIVNNPQNMNKNLVSEIRNGLKWEFINSEEKLKEDEINRILDAYKKHVAE